MKWNGVDDFEAMHIKHIDHYRDGLWHRRWCYKCEEWHETPDGHIGTYVACDETNEVIPGQLCQPCTNNTFEEITRYLTGEDNEDYRDFTGRFQDSEDDPESTYGKDIYSEEE